MAEMPPASDGVVSYFSGAAYSMAQPIGGLLVNTNQRKIMLDTAGECA